MPGALCVICEKVTTLFKLIYDFALSVGDICNSTVAVFASKDTKPELNLCGVASETVITSIKTVLKFNGHAVDV